MGRVRAVAICGLVMISLAPVAGRADVSPRGSSIECVTAPSAARNILLDCPAEYALPTHETSIAVDPTDPGHIVEAAIDGPYPNQTIEFATSFDAGKTWTIGDIPRGLASQNADPFVAFDVKRGTVVMAYGAGGQNPYHCKPPLAELFTVSADGGLSWDDPVIVDPGYGCFGFSAHSENMFEGKVAVDNDPSSPYFGRILITGGFVSCRNLVCSYPVVARYSDDGGATWTRPRPISGSNPNYCTAGGHPPHCDDTFPPSVPAFAPDGTVYVANYNESNRAAWEYGEHGEGQLMVVSSSDGGATWNPPVHVVDLETGSRDYDCTTGTFGCRLTGTNLFPYYAASNVAVSPDGTLYLAFSDNRNGRHDVPHPLSNNDVFVMTSSDGGKTWSGPDAVSNADGDQFKPTIAVNPVTGELGVLFYDRSAAPHGKTMNITLATGRPGGFTLTKVTTAPSHVSDDLWDEASLPDCRRCVFHLGEYIGLAYGPDGVANMSWADLRHYATTPTGRSGYAMNVDFARS